MCVIVLKISHMCKILNKRHNIEKKSPSAVNELQNENM
jgi:hypothetical protein